MKIILRSQLKQMGLLTLLLLSFISPALAANVQKLGFIDTARVYRETVRAQEINQALQQEFAKEREKLDAMQREGEALKKKIEAQTVKSKKGTMIQELDQLRYRYLLAEQQFAEAYSLRRNEEFAALQQEANRVIVKLARDEGYDLILQEAVYVNVKFDITDQVIKALNHE